MKVTILGGGLAALSIAKEIQERKNIEKITILEKENSLGGLCRSFEFNGIKYDVGPHIFFSKDKEILDEMLMMLKDNYHEVRRSNRIIHDKRLIQYPFENDLSKLNDEDKNYAVTSFVHNPYENYDVTNMLQFFLKTFGEGITNIYLRPYNEKIWKYDPSFMNTSMVERIPKPTHEEIMRSANGETVDGYVHQLYFKYPLNGGTQAFIDAYVNAMNEKVKFVLNANVNKVSGTKNDYKVYYNENDIVESDIVISTIPTNILTNICTFTPKEVRESADNLKYNSIIIYMIELSKDLSGNNFAFMVADKNVIFHRISKVNFLGKSYGHENTATYMIEVTYRKNDIYDKLSSSELDNKIVEGLKTIGFMDDETEVIAKSYQKFEYAYVIYDLNHTSNINNIRDFFKDKGIYLNGRFGNFEYWNMDQVIKESKKVAKEIGE